MNLRQKYKKAKKELEIYRKQKVGGYTLIKREERNVQTLQRKMIVDPRSLLPSNILENRIRDELARDVKGFMTVEHLGYGDEHIVCASIKVVDQSDIFRPQHLGHRAEFFLMDEIERSEFTKEQLWPKVNPYLKEEG